jgi:NADP-dependent 3-hydroxy acid dehydrogenase YdfG
MACYSAFLARRQAVRLILPRGRGNIFFRGATASMHGGSGFAAFASAKFGFRAIAQAAARELGPQNIRVAPFNHRLKRRHRMGTATDRSEGRAADNRQSRSESIDASFRSSRGVLAVVPAAARGVDVRARNETLRREILMSVQWV